MGAEVRWWLGFFVATVVVAGLLLARLDRPEPVPPDAEDLCAPLRITGIACSLKALGPKHFVQRLAHGGRAILIEHTVGAFHHGKWPILSRLRLESNGPPLAAWSGALAQQNGLMVYSAELPRARENGTWAATPQRLTLDTNGSAWRVDHAQHTPTGLELHGVRLVTALVDGDIGFALTVDRIEKGGDGVALALQAEGILVPVAPFSLDAQMTVMVTGLARGLGDSSPAQIALTLNRTPLRGVYQLLSVRDPLDAISALGLFGAHPQSGALRIDWAEYHAATVWALPVLSDAVDDAESLRAFVNQMTWRVDMKLPAELGQDASHDRLKGPFNAGFFTHDPDGHVIAHLSVEAGQAVLTDGRVQSAASLFLGED